MAIHTDQYASFDTISFIIFLLNWLNGDKEAFFLPEARRAFLIVATLQCFLFTSLTTVKNHTNLKGKNKNVSYLGTTERQHHLH